MNKISLFFAFAFFMQAGISFSQVVAFHEDFESVTIPGLPAGWAETHTGGGNGWITNSGLVKWSDYNMLVHGKYCMVDNFHHYRNNPALMTTSSFSLVGVSNPHLSFDVFFSHTGGDVAWIEISTNGGATFTVLDTISIITGDWYPVFEDLSGITPASNCKLRFGYADQVGIDGLGTDGIGIDNIAVYQPATTDLGLDWIFPLPGSTESYVRVGDSICIQGPIINDGTSTIPFYETYVQAASGGPIDSFGTSAAFLPFTTRYYGALLQYHVMAPGPQTVKVWISVPGDANQTNDTLTTVITGVSLADWPKKKYFLEDRTGTWCGYCPRGIVYMDSIWRHHSDSVNIASVHGDIPRDPMSRDNASIRAYDTFFSTNNFGEGYPDLYIDRWIATDPTLVFTSLVDTRVAYFGHGPIMSRFGFADLGLYWGVSGSTLTATAAVTPAMNLSGDYRLELIVTEDDVSGTSFDYIQANDFSSSGCVPDQAIDSSYNFCDSSGLIPAGHLKFQFVARWTVPTNLITGYNGVSGSLPGSMSAGTVYNYTFDPVTILPSWNAAKLHCTALLINNNTQSPDYTRILNSSHIISSPLFVKGLNDNRLNLEIYPNPADQEMNISFSLEESTPVSFCVYNMLGQSIISIPPAPESAGEQHITIPTASIPAGTYYLSVQTGNDKTAKLFSIIK